MIVAAAPLSGQESKTGGLYHDPLDGRFDMSASMAKSYGFLPLAAPITEPALEYGAVAAVAFFHRPNGWSLEEARAAYDRGDAQRAPSVTAVAGGYTGNHSWFAGAGHMGIWREDRIRYLGAGGYGSLQLAVSGLTELEQDRTFRYEMEGWLLVQSLRWRVGTGGWFLGAQWQLVGTETRFVSERLPGFADHALASRNGGLSALLSYDSRNNFFTPDRGVLLDVKTTRYDEWLGGDYAYWRGDITAATWLELGSSLVLGVRAKGGSVAEGVPFWGLVPVQMRGVPAQQYVGSEEAQMESELRWDLDPRWSVVGFAGVGGAWNEVGDETYSRIVGSGGLGVRYLVARAFGLRGGGDFAYGPDGPAFYMIVGSAW